MNTQKSPAAGLPGSQGQNPFANAQEADDIEAVSDTKGPIRLGFWVLLVGFGLFLAWAAWAPLHEGVSAQATVSVETRRKTIQHMQGGVIRNLAAVEGAEVKQGDVLITLDDSAAKASYESVRQAYFSQRALESRLMAEVIDKPAIDWHADLTAAANDPMVSQHMAVQTQLFNARRAAQRAELAAAEQSIAGLQGQANGIRQMIESKRAQQALQSKQLAGVKTLSEEGFAPRNQALQMEQAQADLRSTMSDMESNLNRAQSSAAETRLHIAQRRQEYLKEVSKDLADVRREVEANQVRLAAITEEVGRMQIKAPVAGQVIGLAVNGVGGVVQPGQHLMDILPRGETLLLDVKVPPQSIDRIKMGDAVEVRFSAFANTPQLVAQAKLVKLSGDAVTENTPAGAQSFYVGRVELTPEGMKAMGPRLLQPGMPAEVLIKTGERSLLTYLLHPLLKRVAASMTEE